MKKLKLYSTSGCHLCDLAEQVLTNLVQEAKFSWEVVEISDDDDLVERYGIRIPVVQDEKSLDELGWPFDEQSLALWLKGLS